MSTWQYDSSSESNLMKVKYGKLIEKQFNQAAVLMARIKKKDNFVGSQIEEPVVQSIGGGVSAGSLPTANENKIAKAIITSKSVYAKVSIDRESMKAAKSDEGSFVRFTKFPVKIATASFNRNVERMMTRGSVSGSGELITGNASNSVVTGAGTACSPYLVDFDVASTYFPAHFESIEEGDILNVNSETTELEVVAVAVAEAAGYATGTLSLVGTSSRLATLASGCGTAFGASDSVYMQKSKDNEMIGLQGALQATSGSLYNISVGRRWQSFQKAAAGAALSTDLMNEVVMNVKRKCGESPNLILSSYHQYIKILNLLEDHKRYPVSPREKSLKGKLSFSAILYASPDGDIPIVMSRFVDSDKLMFLNDNHLQLHLRPGGFEWFDEDGTVFLRESGDSYEARYGGYGQFFINPHFQGIITGLQV